MMAVVGSIAFWMFILFSSLILFPIACLVRITTFLFDRRLTLLHRFTSYWGSLYTWVNPLWRVQIEGRRNLPHAGAYVIVSNHQSLVDIFVLFRLPIHYKWVSKISSVQ
jgi:1-acyl-sn-glycerol-3-phosphate acyltransferase